MNEMKSNHGFTLVEMLVTLAAATILMSGVLVVVSASARDRLHMKALEDRQTLSQERLLELLRIDLVNARALQPLPEDRGIVMSGFAAIDHSTFARNDRAVEVRYEVQGDETHKVVIRQQRYLDERVPTKPWTEIVVDGVSALTVTTIGAAQAEPTKAQVGGQPDNGVGSEFRIEVRYLDPSRPPLQCVLLLH
jgi:prepilin-type N-terminal cleavage/methylation domain-containing protein